MLYDAKGFQKIYIKPGRTDLRLGVDGLAALIYAQLDINPFQKDVLFLFCGTRHDRIKGLVWEGDGFLLLYKRINDGRFQWPNNEYDVMDLTQQQFEFLMQGFTVEGTIRQVTPKHIC